MGRVVKGHLYHEDVTGMVCIGDLSRILGRDYLIGRTHPHMPIRRRG